MMANNKLLDEPTFFGVHGRLNRKPHFFRKVILLVFNVVVSTILMSMLGLWEVPSGINEISMPNLTGGMLAGLTVWTIILAVTTISWITLSIRRLHDLNHSGWWVLLNFVTVINGFTVANWLQGIAVLIWLAFNLYILLMRGTAGRNDFGADPLMEFSKISRRPQIATF